MKRKIYTGEGVSASGPYSHAVDAGDYVFFSGQTAMNSLGKNNSLLKGKIDLQTKEIFSNLASVMKAADIDKSQVVKVNVYLTSMKHFEAMNGIYQEFFESPYPARTCVAVKELPLGADIEIEVIAKK